MGEAPALWAWVHLFVMDQRSLESLPEVLGRRRLQAVRSVEVKEVWEEWEVPVSLLQAVASHTGLKEVRIKADLSSIDLFANNFAKLDKLELRQCKLTPPASHSHLQSHRQQLPAEEPEPVRQWPRTGGRWPTGPGCRRAGGGGPE